MTSMIKIDLEIIALAILLLLRCVLDYIEHKEEIKEMEDDGEHNED